MKLWREDDPELDRDGAVVKGGMFEHQRSWWNLPNLVKALIAGYGGGKTFIGGKRSVSLAMHNAPVPHLVVSPSYKMAKRTTIPMIEALLRGKQSLHPDLWWKYNKVDHEFKIRWRGREARIWIASGDEPQSLKGPNVGSAWIDEPFIQAEEVMSQVFARVRDPATRQKEIDLTGTPEQLNWGYDICEGDRKGAYDIGIVHASTRANRALPKEYADSLERSMTEVAAKAYLEGHFVNMTEGRIYYGFDDKRNVVRLEDPMAELHVGMDFNVDPMAAVVFWVSGAHMHIVAEIELPNADTHGMCSEIDKRYRYPANHPLSGQRRVQKVFPDATGKARKTSAPYGQSDFTIIKDFGFILDAPPANPHVRDRENAVNGKLCPKQGDPTLTVDPSCRKLISYMNKYTHAERNKQKKMSHLLDALGYPVHRLFPIHRSQVVVNKLQGA